MAYCRCKVLQHNLFSTHNEDYYLLDNSSCNLNEVELLLSMQENHDDLRREEAAFVEEIQAVEMHLELEQRHFEEQIIDYENWKEEVILTQEIQAKEMQLEIEQCYFDDQIADYENWLELQHKFQAINIQQVFEA